MAVRLPTFENTQTVQPGPLVSEAPQYAAAQKVAGNIETVVGKNLQREADRQAVEQGGIAGENVAFKPVKGGGRATQVYNQAALAANKYSLAADIGNRAADLTNELGQHVNGNQTLDEFRGRMQAYGQAVLGKVPAENQAYAKNILQAHSNAGLRTLQSKVNKQNNQIAFSSFYGNLHDITALASSEAFQGQGQLATHNLTRGHNLIDDAAKAGFATNKEIVSAKKALDQGYYEGKLLWNYQKAQQADKLAIGEQKDITKIKGILNQNANKNFVQRILEPEGKPVLDLGKGKFATHEMAWTTVDGKPIIYPKVIQDKSGKLKQLSSKDAIDHALKTNEFITAKSDKEAEWFSSNYKKAWNIDGKNITLNTTTHSKKFKELFLKDKSYNHTFDMPERFRLIRKMDNLDKIELEKQGMTKTHLANIKKNLLFKTAHGGEVDQDKLATLLTTSKDPEDLQDKVSLAKQTWSWTEPNQYAPINQMTAASNELKTITPEIVARSDSLNYHNARLGASKQIDNFKEMRLKDPVVQLQDSPVIQKALVDISNGELNITPAQAFVNLEKNLNQPENKIRTQKNQVSAQDVNNLNEMAADPNQGDDAVLATLNDKREADPGTFHYYFNGLMAAGLSPKYQTMMNMWMNPENRTNIDTYKAAWDAAHTSATGKTLPPGKNGSILDIQTKNHALIKDPHITNIDAQINLDLGGKMKDFIGTLTTGAANNSKQIQQVTDDVTNVTKYLYAEKGMKLKDAENGAYDMVIGKLFPVINGTYRVPFDVNPDQVKAKMNEMDLAIKRNETDLKLEAGEPLAFAREQTITGFIKKFEDRDLFLGGDWVNNPSGKGYVKLTVDGNPIHDNKTKKPHGFSTDNMLVDNESLWQKTKKRGTPLS